MKVPSMIETKVNNSLKGSILNLIQRDYQFIAGDKIQEMFANDLLEVINKSYRIPGNWKFDRFYGLGQRLRRNRITEKIVRKHL